MRQLEKLPNTVSGHVAPVFLDADRSVEKACSVIEEAIAAPTARKGGWDPESKLRLPGPELVPDGREAVP
jgi:hypothetical protein